MIAAQHHTAGTHTPPSCSDERLYESRVDALRGLLGAWQSTTNHAGVFERLLGWAWGQAPTEPCHEEWDSEFTSRADVQRALDKARGARIRELRIGQGQELEELGLCIGAHPEDIRRIEIGQPGVPAWYADDILDALEASEPVGE